MCIQIYIIGESGVLTDRGGEHGVWHIGKRGRTGEGWGWGRAHGVGDGELVSLPVAPLVSKAHLVKQAIAIRLSFEKSCGEEGRG